MDALVTHMDCKGALNHMKLLKSLIAVNMAMGQGKNICML